jgi:hypothetical protein
MEELSLLIEDNHPLTFYLDSLIENLNKLKEISEFDIKRLKSLMERITEEKYSEQVDRINDLVKSFEQS